MTSTPEITVHELQSLREAGQEPFLLDVRQPEEQQIATLGGILIPLMELPDRLGELEDQKSEPVVVYCRSGARSGRAVALLRAHGFDQAVNLKGGVLAWSKEIDPSMPTY